jgi:SRSO17 transposase
MDSQRNLAPRARTISGGDGQALQPWMSHSPWSGPAVFAQMQAEITATPALAQGGTRILDASAEETAGTHHVGASRQDNGRLGTVDICRVDTGLIYAHGGGGTRGEGELCLPEEWCGEAWAARRQALGIPEDRTVETKLELGLQLVKRVKAHGLPFDLVACDAFSGRDRHVRAALEAEGVRYAAQVPADTLVDGSEPQVGVPQKRTTKGRARTRRQLLSQHRPHAGRALAQSPQTAWRQVQVRHTERGRLEAAFAVQRVWTVAAGQQPRTEGWVSRRDGDGDGS